MPRPLSLAEHTLLAELVEKSLDAMFDQQFPENGNFTLRRATNKDGIERQYFYYHGYQPGLKTPDGKPVQFHKYVGLADDPALAERVANFKAIKAGRKERAAIVRGLSGIGLPRPPVQIGRITEALAKAGLFRMRALLVGTAAYQTYPAVTGMRMDDTTSMTGDVDVAQFVSISAKIGDRTDPILAALQTVDPTFRAVPHARSNVAATVFRNAAGFSLDVLTPNRGSDDHMGKAISMQALDGAAATPLRFLDFLIYKPVRSVMLHGAGISVNVPAPERYAVHKLIVSKVHRDDAIGTAKARKDVLQSKELILALDQIGRRDALAEVLHEAWERGPRWRHLIQAGAQNLPPSARTILTQASGIDLDLATVTPPRSAPPKSTKVVPARHRGRGGMGD